MIRVFLVAALCVAALAAWTPAALGQVVEAPADVSIAGDPPPPPPDPAPEPPPPPPDPAPQNPAPEPPPEVTPAPEVTPPQETVPIEAADSRPAVHADSEPRPDAARDSAPPAGPATTTAAAPSDVFAEPAQLPPGSAGDDFAFTEQGDAFVLGSGGSGDGGSTAVLGSFTHFASIATAAARIPALGGGDRGAREAVQAGGNGAHLVLVDSSGNTMLFFGLFGGGSGGGAALVFLTALGLLTVFRMMPPDWNSAFRNSTAVWRPSAYVPPIEHPG